MFQIKSFQLLQTKPDRMILHIKWANFMKMTLDITGNNWQILTDNNINDIMFISTDQILIFSAMYVT